MVICVQPLVVSSLPSSLAVFGDRLQPWSWGSKAGLREELCLGACCTLSWADELLICVMWWWGAEHISLLLLAVC